MTLAPLWCAIQFHIKPKRRTTWGEHASYGWYLGTSREHYWCHIIFVNARKTKQITDTVFFKHRYITQPTLTAEDTVVQALQDLMQAIKQQRNVKGAGQFNAIAKMRKVFAPSNNLPLTVPPTMPGVCFAITKPTLATYDMDTRVPLQPPRVGQVEHLLGFKGEMAPPRWLLHCHRRLLHHLITIQYHLSHRCQHRSTSSHNNQ